LSRNVQQIALFLSDPMARLPSFPRMGPSEYAYPVAVKTGTSSNYRDAWAVAWSQRYIVGVWVGDPSCRPMNRLSGFNSAAALAQDVMNRLHRDDMDGLRDLSFPPPRGFRQVRVCALTGCIRRIITPAFHRLQILRPAFLCFCALWAERRLHLLVRALRDTSIRLCLRLHRHIVRILGVAQ
jgi:membrane carboxypeptidase/penicillin-binding protein PbpC